MAMNEKERRSLRELVGLSILRDSDHERDAILRWIETSGGNVLRVVLHDTHAYLETFSSMTNLSIVDGDYPYDMVPDWVKDRVAALYITAPPPPPQPIDGIGVRINENTFWVEAPEEENQWRQRPSPE